MKLLLASSSPYRRQLLGRFGQPFECCAPNINEERQPHEDPVNLAERLSIAKAQAVAPHYPEHLIIGSDQTAVCGDVLYAKPGNLASATRQLAELSGKTALFHSGVCVLNSSTRTVSSAVVTTTVTFRTLREDTIKRYLEREQTLDCAGSFKAEGLGIALFDSICSEDPSALLGLPLIRLRELLEASGYPLI